jgi:hypothetical protein
MQSGTIFNSSTLHLQGVIKLTNAAIQKYPNELVFKSLKAVALQRTGKADEAMQVRDAACRTHMLQQNMEKNSSWFCSILLT